MFTNICTEFHSLEVGESKEISSIKLLFSAQEEMNQDSHCRIKITKSLSEKGDLFSRYALKEAAAITACSVTCKSEEA